MSSDYIGWIKRSILEHQREQAALRAEAQQVHGPARHALNLSRQAAKAWGRQLYLCYALLRGVPYKALEKKTHTPPVLSKSDLFSYEITEDTFHAWIRGEEDAGRSAA